MSEIADPPAPYNLFDLDDEPEPTLADFERQAREIFPPEDGWKEETRRGYVDRKLENAGLPPLRVRDIMPEGARRPFADLRARVRAPRPAAPAARSSDAASGSGDSGGNDPPGDEPPSRSINARGGAS